MKFLPTSIADAYVVNTKTITDERGSFSRLFCKYDLTKIVGERLILQINQSINQKVGAVRGLHYQNPPNAEMKIVRCTKGKVWDVVVDLRKNSKTFLKWYGHELSSQNKLGLVIPEGCAHGFQVLEENSELLYLHTAFYSPSSEAALKYDDPALAIKWPLMVTDISERDKKHIHIDKNFKGIIL